MHAMVDSASQDANGSALPLSNQTSSGQQIGSTAGREERDEHKD
jgi:hypothetical protein